MNTLDYVVQNIREAAILTGSYVAGTVIGLDSDVTTQAQLANECVLLVDFTKGSLTSCEIKIEFSTDNTTFYKLPYVNAPTSGVSTVEAYTLQLTASDKLWIPFPVKARYIKVSAKGTGTVTSSSLTLDVILGTA